MSSGGTKDELTALMVAPLSRKAKRGRPNTVAGKEYVLETPVKTVNASAFLFLESRSRSIEAGGLGGIGRTGLEGGFGGLPLDAFLSSFCFFQHWSM